MTSKEELLAKRNAELEIKLAAKNRELEIEASLEKVRAVAMSMKEPADMLEICRTISNQLETLHIKEIRNVQTAIFYENKGTYMNYEYYAKHDKTFITETTYTNNEIHNAFANQMLKGNGEFFVTHIKGDEVKNWVAYQKTTNVFIDDYLNTASSLNYYWYSLGPVALGISTYEPLKEEETNLFKRFLKVFELSYTRYLDIEQAIAQARESQIQLALERVRARTMAMQKSDELSETALLMFEQLQLFVINLWSCGFNIWEKRDNDCTSFVSRGGKMLPPVTLSLNGNPFLQLFKSKHTEEELWFVEMSGEDNRILYNYIAQQRSNSTGNNNFLSGVTLPDFQRVNVVNFSHGNLMFITLEAHPEMHDIFKRFGTVFEQTYTRFLDLQKAEAQAREAQIEAALEKVRSRSLAVHKSDEFNEVIKVVFERLQELKIPMTSVSINIIIEGSKDTEAYICGQGENGLTLSHIRLIHFDHPIANDRYNAYENGLDFFTKTYGAEEKNSFYEYEFEVSDLKYIPADIKKMVMESQHYACSVAFAKNSMIVVNDFEGKPLFSKQIDIVKRFAKVFEQAYVRYLDLQKAEVHAREAQIELGLERVRARAMAMRESEELNALAGTLFNELTRLGFILVRFIIITIDVKTGSSRWFMANPENALTPKDFLIQYHEHPGYLAILRAWKERLSRWVYINEGELKKKWGDFLLSETELSSLPEAVKAGMVANERVFMNVSFGNFGALMVSTTQPLPDDQFDILLRFAKVFEQTYTRFLDLQTAEAQARESQIQLALERVRAKTMAMQKPSEYVEVINLIGEQFINLGFQFDWVNFSANGHDVSKAIDIWNFVVVPGVYQGATRLMIPYFDHPIFSKAEESVAEYFEHGNEFTVVLLDKKEKDRFLDYLFTNTIYKDLPDEVKVDHYNQEVYLTSNVVLKDTWLSIGTYKKKLLTEEQVLIEKRLAREFGQAYTRFLDLQKAEAQARESQIQLALERVRARTMAMQKSDELSETVYVLFQQFKELGENPDQATIGIINEDEKVIEYWVTMYGNPINKVFKFSIDEPTVTNKIYKAWKENQKSLVIDLSGDALTEFMTYRAGKGGAAINPDEKRRIINVAFFSKGLLNVQSNEERSEESIKLLERFASVFEQTYTRFLDLQKAEAQARESQIQLALERVRARTMAMQKSEELSDVATVLFQQVKALGIPQWTCGFCIWDIGDTECTWYPGGPENEILASSRFPLTEHPAFRIMDESRKRGDELYIYEKEGEAQADHYRYMMTLPGARELLQGMLDAGLTFPTFQIDHYANFAYGNLIFITYEHFPEMHDIFKRFAKVFEQTYTRFLDLQKAEAQARESQIQLALERVRAKTMAMHNSADVGNTVATLFDELLKLGIQTFRCGIGIMQKTKSMEVWAARPDADGEANLVIGSLDTNLHPLLQGAFKGWSSKEESYSYELKDDDLINYFNAINNYAGYPVKYDIASLPKQIFHNDFYFAEGSLFAFSLEPLSAETKKILKGFANVFGQTYRRYLDLQKAEAQAKEAQIEASLERVRSRAMAMQTSEELGALIGTVFTELTKLDLQLTRCVIWIFDVQTNGATWWMANSEDPQNPINCEVSYNAYEPYLIFLEHWKKKTIKFQYELKGKIKKDWDEYLFNKTGLSRLPDFVIAGMKAPECVLLTASFNNFGAVNTASLKPLSDKHTDIMLRFARVFDLTYTRFNDLKQAEASAREAQIEAALERVRGKAMAMHNSNDLSSAASMVFTELRKLGINPIRCGVGLLNKESRKAQLYSAASSADGDSLSLVGWVMLSNHPVLEEIYNTWLKKEDYFPELTGEELKSYYELLLKGLSVNVPDSKDEQKQYGHFFSFSIGCLYAWSNRHYDEAEIKILKRFATIIDLTFRRYLDLQKAEANTKEAVKQSALDRIRADIASMRTVNDLNRITPLIWNELNILGIRFIRCGVFIMNDEQQLIYTFLSTPDGEAIAAFEIPYETPGNIKHVISHWHNNKNYIDHWDENAFTQFADTLVTQGALTSPQQYLKTIPHGGFYLHFLPFLQGMLYVGNTTRLDDDEINLIQSVADAFSTAYARYEDFNKLEAAKKQVEKTLVDLKQTQQQLIQSEKMASLGELTAGIAHEIQNPLNFVNNFSEVNKEMLEELKDEIEKGNTEDARALANDIIENEKKINHHGKRADAIVKGMLQHSRRSSLQKEPTDINALCDEYIRLCFHGLRAKDKSFNSGIITEFDKAIGKINIIPQDISRVILNVLTNAFYAVNERRKLSGDGYQPIVKAATRRLNDKAEIIVEDNGNGIPKNIIEKIFQPFFTTKPTGVGTGLGLSLSYDIIKAHGGEIKVETKEGEGSKFTIGLPLKG